jgi:hypothetical protein
VSITPSIGSSTRIDPELNTVRAIQVLVLAGLLASDTLPEAAAFLDREQRHARAEHDDNICPSRARRAPRSRGGLLLAATMFA